MLRSWPQLDEDRARALAWRVTRPCEGGWIWTWDPLHRTRSASGFDLERFLAVASAIQAQTHMIVGNQSWYGGIDQLQRRCASIEGLRGLSLPTGHNPHVEAPETLTEMLLGLLP